jgi:hypothetical protein
MPAPIGNQNALDGNGGRPPLFDNPDKLMEMIDEYFVYIRGQKTSKVDEQGNVNETWDRLPEPATITGLALYLGFCSKQSLYDYGEKVEFTYPIKKARLYIENKYEQNLHGNSPTGSIFALKNMGWKDKTETEFSGGLQIEQITGMEFKKSSPDIETK